MCGLLILAAFVLLSWVQQPETPMTGLEVFNAATESGEANYIPALVLIPLSAAIAIGLAVWGIADPPNRRIASVFSMVAGFIGLFYYIDFLYRKSLIDVSEVSDAGFGLAFLACAGLILQFFIPRRISEVAVRSLADLPQKIGAFFQSLPALISNHNFRRNVVWTTMTLPAAIWIFIFKYVTLFGVFIAFTNFKARKGITGSTWVGLNNFEFLFSTDQAVRAMRNTVLLNLLFIFVGLIMSLFVAWMMYEIYSSALTKYYQTMLLLPRFISWVIVAYFVFAMLKVDNGLVNKLLEGIGGEPVGWYSSPEYWPFILLLANLWNGVGMGSLLYLSGMLSINPQLFEAAEIDGANKWQQFKNVMFPFLRPIIAINLLLALSRIFNADFGLFYQVPRDQALLYPATDVLDTYIYRALTESQNMAMASAANFFQSIVGFFLVISANWVVRRIERDDEPLALF